MKHTSETITTRSGLALSVRCHAALGNVHLSITADATRPCVLHWGLNQGGRSAWHKPAQSEGPMPEGAMQTPFVAVEGKQALELVVPEGTAYGTFVFVLYFPSENQWDNNTGGNYYIALPTVSSGLPERALSLLSVGLEIAMQREIALPDARKLALALGRGQGRVELTMATDMPGALILHWGVSQGPRRQWALPPTEICPEGTVVYQGSAAWTSFASQEGLNTLKMHFAEAQLPEGILFVLLQKTTGRWVQDQGRNFHLSLNEKSAPPSAFGSRAAADAAEQIIEAEVTKGSWTLMHRYELCHDLLERMQHDLQGMDLMVVWLRLSAIRQLDWQRHYNTKPKELSHSLERLTSKMAQIYRDVPSARGALRLMFVSVGRGGEGQRIRDEILVIMHRHHIKEVTGHFLEEWHQKLHNNTTPDDIAICEAYIEFLRSYGNHDVFYNTLKAGGVSRERLRSFERPITTDPDFVPHLRDALIYDFGNYLKVLKSVHSGTDLEVAFEAATFALEHDTAGRMRGLLHQKNAHGVAPAELAQSAVAIRRALHMTIMREQDVMRLRAMLWLDLALEEFQRLVVERTAASENEGPQLAWLLRAVAESMHITTNDQELGAALKHWERLLELELFTQQWAMHAKAVCDRFRRYAVAFVDGYYERFQGIAQYLGDACNAEQWALGLFTEEMVRGQAVFALSQLLNRLDPVLRSLGHMGQWQVVGTGKAAGTLLVVDNLRSLQGRRFDVHTIVLAGDVAGDEEPPPGVVAIVTPRHVDVVSHVAVRARNARLLFATCYDADTVEQLRSLKGRTVVLEVSPSGDVNFSESAEVPQAAPIKQVTQGGLVEPAGFESFAIGPVGFTPKRVGKKALNLKLLEGMLPEGVKLPQSVSIPFGVFEHVLQSEDNFNVARELAQFRALLDPTAQEGFEALKESLLKLRPPQEFWAALDAVMGQTGLPIPSERDAVWRCIVRVWASKWNQRAYASRLAMGIPDDALYMSVLVQQAWSPLYAFVLHTVNPLNNNASELYAELVAGLGETLVGNHPGRAFSFIARKGAEGPSTEIVSFPSKGFSLHGGGLIFRSDSNAEDLSGYAGAGLYDSVMLVEPAQSIVDYTQMPLLWDEGSREELVKGLVTLGSTIERALGGAQDIEGVVLHDGTLCVVQSRPQVGL